MRNVIIGTAGHVDHGKTMLIKTLTGIDTDRLREEKERGMTIDLGFAVLKFPNGQRAGIVDVPGHERFLKNMLAGAGGVDVALMVIAADESVMPQTLEHLDILNLLEVRHGVIAVTKSDLVDSDWLEVVREDIRTCVRGTFLENALIVSVSSLTGDGIADLTTALQQECEKAEGRPITGAFRLPIDRVFTLTGFGTVVTGTLVSGTVRIGDQAEIMPMGLQTRVRTIQVHGSNVQHAEAGTRVAMNLANVEVSDIRRGAVCATPGLLKPSKFLDVRVVLLKRVPRPLINRARIRLHIGTSEVIGRITLLDRDSLTPGDEAPAQFEAESHIAALRGDRFVIRSYSPMMTIGGGTVLEPTPTKHKRFDTQVISLLQAGIQGSHQEVVEQTLRRIPGGATPTDLAKACGISEEELLPILKAMKHDGRIVEIGGSRLFHVDIISRHKSELKRVLAEFHTRHSLKPGMPKEELRNSISKELDVRTFTSLLTQMHNDGEVVMSDVFVSLANFQPSLGTKEQAAHGRIVSELRKAGLNAPSVQELLHSTGLPIPQAKDLLDLLIRRGEIVRIADDICLHRDILMRVEQQLRDYLGKHGKITISQFRDLAGTTRKYAVPLMEYFDKQKITRRVGDERVLVKP